MKIAQKLTALASAAALVLSMAAALPAVPAAAASAVVVDTTKTYQNIRGFGGINHPEWTGADMSEAQRKTAFGNGDGELGLTVLRVFVNPDSNQWKLAVPTAKYVSDLGYTVFASPWEPPSSIAASGGTGGLAGKLHLPESNYAAYAEHLNNFGQYMKDNGVDLYSISVQNEPDYASEWTAWTPEQTTKFIAEYGDKITSTRLMSPESFQYGAWNNGKDYYKQILANEKAFANCDVFGTHFYGTGRNQMDFPELESCGKEIWMTEVYVPNSDANSANNWPEALQVSENIHNGLVVGSMSVYTWWYIRRSYGLMTEDGVPSKRGWCMAQYSKYVRPGAVRIEATESPANDVLVSAYKNADGTVAIVAINKGSSEITQQFTLGSGEQIIDVDRYRTSASENAAATLNMEYSGSGFWSQLPANSVSTYVVTLEGGTVTPPTTEPTEPTVDEDGYFFHDTFEGDTFSWTNRGSAEVGLSGRIAYAGDESLLAQGRTSAWNGMTKALSTKTFKPGTAYSFSVDVTYLDGEEEVDTFCLKLQYTGSDGETHYASIAEGKTMKGKWVQLANESFTIPEGASDLMLYVETPETTNNFYIDEAIGAPEGTKIPGAGQPEITEPTTPTTPSVSDGVKGDVNGDKSIDVVDLVMMKRILLGKATATAGADVDGSGKVDMTDYVALYQYIHRIIKAFPDNAPEVQPSAGLNLSREAFTAWASAQMSEKEPDVERTQKAGVQYGKVTKETYYSTTCQKNRPVNILLPANYSTNKQYPVLYVMHGYWEDEDRMINEASESLKTKEIIGNAIAAGEAEDMIVVFPYIYASATQDACSGMDDANNAAYDNFINELKNDLMPYIESNYPVKTGKDNTAITGFSMGGRESLYIGMKCSDMFGYVGAICAAPGVNDLIPTSEFRFTGETPYLLLLTAGSNDTVVYNTPEGYHNTLTANGVPHIWHYVDGGYHGDNCIRAHLYNFSRFIFKN